MINLKKIPVQPQTTANVTRNQAYIAPHLDISAGTPNTVMADIKDVTNESAIFRSLF